jgi:hypothetical protein
MTQHGAIAAGEDCRHPAPVPAQAFVSHGVDTTVDAMEVASLYASGDAVLAHPQLLELSDSNHAVLASRDPCDGRIELVEFLPHVRE